MYRVFYYKFPGVYGALTIRGRKAAMAFMHGKQAEGYTVTIKRI